MHIVKLALNAMATRFELVLHGDDPVFLRAAGQEALAEIKRLHQRLSFYDPSSSISHINRNAYQSPVQINSNLYSLLKLSKEIHHLTHGAFDITIGPLMKIWGFVQGTGVWPYESQRKEALEKTGMDKLIFDDQQCTVTFQREGMAIDLGAIGKGYAIEEATTILKECGITSALLHGGTSTMTAIGVPHDDPRLGYPVQGARLSAVSFTSATICDALSTAFLSLEREEISEIAQNFNKMRILCIYADSKEQNHVEIGFPTTNQ